MQAKVALRFTSILLGAIKSSLRAGKRGGNDWSECSSKHLFYGVKRNIANVYYLLFDKKKIL
jgi:hypothetical protein